MDVLVTGRHCQIPDEFRARVEEKIASIEKLKDRVIRVEVQVSAYGYKRQPDQSTRVEITLRSRGPVVRAEASADDKTVAFDHALDRLKSQLRRAFDRRKTHRGLRENVSLADGELVAGAAIDEVRKQQPGSLVVELCAGSGAISAAVCDEAPGAHLDHVYLQTRANHA